LTFYQPLNGYSYNSDSIYLYDFISDFKPKGKLLDVGSGCGIIGLLLARDFNIELHQIELQDTMSFLSQKNAEINNIKLNHNKINFLDFNTEVKYDYIISNPPFYHQDVVQSDNQQINICRYNNHLPIDKFFQKVTKLLNNRGYFIFCYHPREISTLLIELKNAKLTVEDIRFVHPKIEKDANLIMIKCRKNSKAMTKLHKPFIAFDNTEFSDEANNIYKKARTYTIKCDL
jgi:tRNA1(Val) A37 N6-methylase TrmN6